MSNLVGEMPAGAVDLGGSAQAASVGYSVGAVGFGPHWSVEDSMAASIVRLECEADELRATIAMMEAEREIMVAIIGGLKAENAAIFAQLISLQAGSRRATLDEIAESVREKYEPEHEGEGMENG
jgi:predicted NUDIX family NTP pyrophosphohydrolase